MCSMTLMTSRSLARPPWCSCGRCCIVANGTPTDGYDQGVATAWIGTSGWQYQDWRGSFYPRDLPTGRWLEHYAARFRTVELNNSFYRLPPRPFFEDWARRTPDDFVFVVKASRYLSHVKRLADPEEPVDAPARPRRGARPQARARAPAAARPR